MPEFHQLMRDLLQFMQIPPSRLAPNEVYSFTIDGMTEVSFLQRQPDSIDLLVHAATLANPKADGVLRSLLAMNLFAVEGPNVSVGMNPETGAISLWLRMPLSGMDVPTLVGLIELAVQRAASVRTALRERHAKAANHDARRTTLQRSMPGPTP